MKGFKLILSLACLLLGSRANSQIFEQQPPEKIQSFKEIQRQFDAWAKTRDLSKTRYWKYFKRLETEMQYHTDASGEPADPAIFISEALKYAETKQAAAGARFAANAWYPVGPSAVPNNQTGYMENGIGRINCIAFHPSSTSTYFVGVAQGGVWKTTNNGQTWTPLTDNLPITRISDIAIDPNNPNTMYISVCDYAYIGAGLFLDGRKRNTHYGLGVYKTTNGGATWAPTGLTFQQLQRDASLIKKIMIDPANSNNVIACGVSGMYRSTNGGTTWTKMVTGLFWDLVQNPATPATLYAATGWVKTANTGESKIYKSTNFGQTWNVLTTGIPATGSVQRLKLAVAPSDPNYVYAIAVNTTNGLYGIYKTTNAGTTWQFIDPGVNVLDAYTGNTPNGQGNYDLALMVSQTNPNLLYSGGVNIWGSADGGTTFHPASHWTTAYGPTLHGDIQFMAIQPVTGNVFVCNDGGLYRTGNLQLGDWLSANNNIPWPTQWTNISHGMAITSFYRLSSSKDIDGKLVAGAQDNATFFYNGTNWNTILGGDGMDNFIDPNNNFTIMASSQFGNFAISFDEGQTFMNVNPATNGEKGEWTTPVIAQPGQPNNVFVGYENVYKSTNQGSNWTKISNFPSGFNKNEISALAIAPSNPSVLYAAKRVRYEFNIPGSVYKTTNGGTSWVNVTAGIPDSLYYTSLEVAETNPNLVYVSMAGFSAGRKVYRSTNGGTAWQNISYNLPNIPVNCVKQIPGTNYLMAATDLGIYTLGNNATAWVSQSTGLPNVIISDIEFNPALNKVYVSTFGRGIWATDLDVFVTGTGEKAIKHTGISLFPSPNKGSFSIAFESKSLNKQQIKLEIIDITGRVLYTEMLFGKSEYKFDLKLAPGLYHARLSTDKFNGVQKFLVE